VSCWLCRCVNVKGQVTDHDQIIPHPLTSLTADLSPLISRASSLQAVTCLCVCVCVHRYSAYSVCVYTVVHVHVFTGVCFCGIARLCAYSVCIQCIRKVFRPLDFFSHFFMLQPQSRMDKICFSLINLHKISHNDTFLKTCKQGISVFFKFLTQLFRAFPMTLEMPLVILEMFLKLDWSPNCGKFN
jgi:hypothetical protein